MKPLVDPRDGDVEDDASSTKSNSLLTMAGSLLGEISLAKLIAAWLILFIVPAVIVGLAPLIASAWIARLAGKITSPLLGVMPIALLLAVAALGWLFGRRLFHLAESSFWSLNALVIEPAYTFCREALRHLAERTLPESAAAHRRERFRSWAAAVSGLLISGVALLVLILVWPSSRWIGEVGDLLAPGQLVWVHSPTPWSSSARTWPVLRSYGGWRMRRCLRPEILRDFRSRHPVPASGALPTCPTFTS
jgi:hypothetical protein